MNDQRQAINQRNTQPERGRETHDIEEGQFSQIHSDLYAEGGKRQFCALLASSDIDILRTSRGILHSVATLCKLPSLAILCANA